MSKASESSRAQSAAGEVREASGRRLGGRWVVAGVLGMMASLTIIAVAIPGVVLQTDHQSMEDYGAMPSFELTDHTGDAITDTALRGTVVIANFIFTRCATVCPVMSMKMQAIQQRTASIGEDLKLVSFSVDPEHDTPEVLAEYAANNGTDSSRWRFITGDTEAVASLVSDGFRLALEQTGTQPNGAPDIAHAEHFVLIDRSGRIRGYYNSNDIERIDRMLADARRLVIRRH